ncbi:MAG: transglutaminase-like domain-containing protein [Proteobacteria bacterium]|nr:transglutaminase-like domain-containing protein [Pseudomonadota bacterium]
MMAWLVLFGLLLKRDYFIDTLRQREAQVLEQHAQESFLGVYFNAARIGYVKNSFTQTVESEITLTQEAYLLLNILNEHHPVRMRGRAFLTSGYLLKEFSIHFESPFYRMDATGEVEGTTVHFVIDTGKERITDSVSLNSPPFISTNRRAYLLDASLHEDSKIKVPYFDPILLTGQDAVVQYKGRDKQIIQGRIYNLHRFVESYNNIRVSSWLNDEGLVVKEETPAGFVFIAEPEFRATEISKNGPELLSSVSVPLAGTMPDLAGRKEISFRLQLPENSVFPALDNDRQHREGDILTVTLEDLPDETAQVCQGQSAELSSTSYIQVESPAIKQMALSLIAQAPTPLEKVRTLSQWIYLNLEKRPVLGLPDALTTLGSRKGDCNEHAALFAALARSAGIPTRVVAGVTFHAGAFYYHAWNEICMGENWISVDTTKNELPADLTHIKFVHGEIGEQLKIGALLGKLRVAIAE